MRIVCAVRNRSKGEKAVVEEGTFETEMGQGIKEMPDEDDA